MRMKFESRIVSNLKESSIIYRLPR